MLKQIIFISCLIFAFGALSYSFLKIFAFFKLTKTFPVRDFGKRTIIMLKIAIGQTKIFRRPLTGFFHALVFWGFCVILFGSLEMMLDGVFDSEKCFSFLGFIYNFLIASGDIFALLVLISVIIFLFRRLCLHIKRFTGIEMKHNSHMDANIALTLILLLMASLLGMNTFYLTSATAEKQGLYPISQLFASWFGHGENDYFFYEIFWWMHILLVFLFMNILPYSKHFHVFMSVPNVFLSRLEPLGKLPNMDNVTKEVKIMMDPALAYVSPANTDNLPERFGVKDVEDVTWKSYLDSLSCTECGRCTSVCPANITGKKLSPRKVVMNIRARMKEKGTSLLKDKQFNDNKSLIRDFVSTEELWACTTCNACAKECPININHPVMIMDMRRYLVMEESSAPSGLNTIFANIQNNGAPWQFSPEDRMLWANEIYIKNF